MCEHMFDSRVHPHCRYNPLDDSWVLVSPQRTQRPWHGEQLASQATAATESVVLDTETANANDNDTHSASQNLKKPYSHENKEGNYLAPLAQRSSGHINPDYKTTFAFDNDFPALLAQRQNCCTPLLADEASSIFGLQQSVHGKCRVLCLNPDPSISWPSMSDKEAQIAISFIIDEYRSLYNTHLYEWIQVFENRGSAMGCSNMHPHCQIWATDIMPDLPRKRDANLRAYHAKHKRSMLTDYAQWELSQGNQRIVCDNEEWICVVPFWAIWPYECMLLQKRSTNYASSMLQLDQHQTNCLASIIKQVVSKYDRLFNCQFPYTLGFFSKPSGQLQKLHQEDHTNASEAELKVDLYSGDAWAVFASFLPPLLRSASIRKYMVGFELFAQPQRDITAEYAAARLRSVI